MKYIVFLLSLCSLTISACLSTELLPSTMEPQDLIGTIVAQTLTAKPSYTLVAPTNTIVPNTPTSVPPT